MSQSQLNMMGKCPAQWERRYVMGELIPPGVPMLRGTGTHTAAEINHKQKIKSREDLPVGDLTDAARDKFVTRAQEEGIYLLKEDLPAKNRILNDGLNDAVRCVEVYHKEIAPQIQPIAVEEKIGPLDVGLDLSLVMYLDLRQDGSRITDLKSTGKKWPKGKIKDEVQALVYSLGHVLEFGINPVFEYHIAIARRGTDGKATSEGADYQSHTFAQSDYDGLYYKMEAFCRMVKGGVFPPCNQSAWWCDPKWCGYHATCRYCGNSPSRKWV